MGHTSGRLIRLKFRQRSVENHTFQGDNVLAIHPPLFITIKLQFVISQDNLLSCLFSVLFLNISFYCASDTQKCRKTLSSRMMYKN